MISRLLRSGSLVAVTVVAIGGHAVAGLAQPSPVLRAQTVLPPGNSFLYTVDGVVAGNASGEPDDYGPWVDDQREMYWDYAFKDGGFVPSPDACGGGEVTASDRAPGLERVAGRSTAICWSAYGVPAVFAESAEDLWYGSGWVAGKLRLFLLDAIRRTARGTLSELAGAGESGATLAEDVRTRYQTYSEAEYTAFYDALGPEARLAVDAYVAGVNDWMAFVTQGQGAPLLPAEYGVLTSLPEQLTPQDVLAIGVLMTRFVASEGKREFQWVRALRALEAEFGVDPGRALFLDFVSQEDGQATTTVLASEGTFPRTGQTAAERAAAFDALADWAATLPHDLDVGPGADGEQQGGVAAGAEEESPAAVAANPAAVAAAALQEWTSALTGGSFQVSIAPERTADGSTLLISEPQLGYDPVLLMEVQLTGAGYDARGVTVPGIPVVGIGYTPTVAWSLTTGNSKTVDTFVETVRPDTNDDGAIEYLHGGAWKDATCREETVTYRESPEGVPVGPAAFSETHTVCRTVHGPIVAPSVADIDEEGDLAISYEWHMANREVDTIAGVLAWNRADSAQDIIDSIPSLTWNENIGWADRAGRIGWWHPGLHRTKAPGSDLRLPLPGTGEYDNGAYLDHTELPHVIDPARGWVVNWNNKPAHGWLDGGGQSETSLPAGIDARAATLADVVAARDDWTFDDLVELDREASSLDFRARHYLPMILGLRGSAGLSDAEAAALELLAAWDGSANGPGADMEFAGYDAGAEGTTVGAAPTIFDRMMDVLVEDLFGFMRSPAYSEDGQEFTFDLVGRQLFMGRHMYDMSPPLHVALRALDPATSTLGTARDYLRGRSPRQVLLDTLEEAVGQLTAESGADPSAWRSVYVSEARGLDYGEVCNPTAVIGPCGHMPFLERGTWIHYTGWTGAAPQPAPATPGPDSEVPAMPVTGGGAALAVLAVLAAGRLAGRRRN